MFAGSFWLKAYTASLRGVVKKLKPKLCMDMNITLAQITVFHTIFFEAPYGTCLNGSLQNPIWHNIKNKSPSFFSIDVTRS